MKWKKHIHPMFKHLAEMESLNQDLVKALGSVSMTFSKYQYLCPPFSIISPSDITQNRWELYDGEDIYGFRTLKEAKEYAKGLNPIK